MKKKLFLIILVFIIGVLLVLLVPYTFKVIQEDNLVSIQYTEMNRT